MKPPLSCKRRKGASKSGYALPVADINPCADSLMFYCLCSSACSFRVYSEVGMVCFSVRLRFESCLGWLRRAAKLVSNSVAFTRLEPVRVPMQCDVANRLATHGNVYRACCDLPFSIVSVERLAMCCRFSMPASRLWCRACAV